MNAERHRLDYEQDAIRCRNIMQQSYDYIVRGSYNYEFLRPNLLAP